MTTRAERRCIERNAQVIGAARRVRDLSRETASTDDRASAMVALDRALSAYDLAFEALDVELGLPSRGARGA